MHRILEPVLPSYTDFLYEIRDNKPITQFQLDFCLDFCVSVVISLEALYEYIAREIFFLFWIYILLFLLNLSP